MLTPLPTADGYGELFFNQNLDVGGGVYRVYDGTNDAQSFTPWESILLLSVSLHVDNIGSSTDYLNVTIQSDAAGSPSGTILAWSEQRYTGAAAWGLFPLTPAVPLTQGSPYWIVANNTASFNQGYEWTHSGTDVVPGEAKRDFGAGWTLVAEDFAFTTYGLRLEPYLSLALDADRRQVSPGDIVTLTVFLNNSGARAPLGAWLNLTLPTGLTYEADTAAFIGGTGNGTSWSFGNLTNGARSFTVAVLGGPSPTRYLNAIVRLDFTDSSGVRLLPQTASVQIEAMQVLPPPGGDPSGWYLWLVPLAAAVVPVTFYGIRRKNRPSIEEVFVIHTSGVLLYHLGRSMKSEEDKDKDVLGSMFTVVQDFVRDSFRYGEDRILNKLEFGDYKILIERGPNLYLAIASSADVEQLANRAKRAIDEIEQAYGTELAKFSGRMEPILGIRDLVKKHLRLA